MITQHVAQTNCKGNVDFLHSHWNSHRNNNHLDRNNITLQFVAPCEHGTHGANSATCKHGTYYLPRNGRCQGTGTDYSKGSHADCSSVTCYNSSEGSSTLHRNSAREQISRNASVIFCCAVQSAGGNIWTWSSIRRSGARTIRRSRLWNSSFTTIAPTSVQIRE